MNTYLVPIKEGDKLYIKKIMATSFEDAKDRLYNYFLNKYDEIDETCLEDMVNPLWDIDVEFGDIKELEEFE